MQNEKKKNNNAIWLVILIILIVAVIWFVNNRLKAASLNYNPQAQQAANQNITYVSVNENTVLKSGMNNAEVKKLQALINKVNASYGYPKISEDGAFGPKTEASLKTLTGKTSISYAEAYKMATAKLQAKGYSEDQATEIITPEASVFGGGLLGLF